VCYQRKTFKSVPGCSGLGQEAMDYCCDLPPNNLFYIGRDTENNTLSVFQGDCDHDDDCISNLICGDKNVDASYCHYANSQFPTLSPSESPLEKLPSTSPSASQEPSQSHTIFRLTPDPTPAPAVYDYYQVSWGSFVLILTGKISA